MTQDLAETNRAAEPPSPVRARLIDKRPVPKGVLPRQLQTWLMVGIAVVILGIIAITGRPEPLPAEAGREPASQAPSLLPPDRVRTYQQRLTEQEARLRQELTDAEQRRKQEESADAPEPRHPTVADALADDRRRREYESLFADNVALSRRPAADRPSPGASPVTVAPTADQWMQGALTAPTWPPLSPAVPGAPMPPSSPAAVVQDIRPPEAAAASSSVRTADRSVDDRRSANAAPTALSGPMHRLLEGTVIEAVLLNRLDGTFSGAVNCLVTTPVYSHSRQHVLIPAGARVLGSAAPVQTVGESRLAVRFHRLVMPDGRSYSLDRFTGLNQAGDAGLKDQVDRHYWQVFSASLAIGMLAGFTQHQTRGPLHPDAEFSDAYRQGVGSSLASSGGRILDRFLNILPTITIREGHRVRIYLTSDFELPEYLGS